MGRDDGVSKLIGKYRAQKYHDQRILFFRKKKDVLLCWVSVQGALSIVWQIRRLGGSKSHLGPIGQFLFPGVQCA